MKLFKHVVRGMDQNVYFYFDEDTKEGVIVDPGDDAQQIIKLIDENEIKVKMILLTHGHGDHIGDAISIAKRTDATVYAVVEIADEILAPEGIKVGRGNIGGKQKTSFGKVKYFPASHGSGVSGALACGYIFEIGDKKIYHAGDTGLIAEMQFLKNENIDIALLPIGDFYTMGPEDALIATRLISPKCVIPMHYNTFPAIVQNPEDFKKAVESEGICQVKILNPGESLEI